MGIVQRERGGRRDKGLAVENETNKYTHTHTNIHTHTNSQLESGYH